MLGQMQASAASNVLLKNINVRTIVISRLDPLSTHPAAHALVQIGSPIYPSFFGYCGQELTESNVRLLAYVVRGIDGKGVGVFRLRDKLDKYQVEMRKGWRKPATT